MTDSWSPDRSTIERLARAQLSMTPGTAHGRVAQASPVRNTGRQEDGSGDIVEAIFSYSGLPRINEESPPYYNRIAGADMGTVIINTRSNTTGSTSVDIMVNGVVVTAITLPAGNHMSAEELVEGVTLDYGDQLTVNITSMPANLDGLVVQVLLEE